MQQKLKDFYEEDLKYTENKERNIQRMLTELKEDKKQLYRKMATGKLPDDEEYRALQEEPGQKIATAESELMNIANSTADFLEKASNLIELCRQAKKLFAAGTHEENSNF